MDTGVYNEVSHRLSLEKLVISQTLSVGTTAYSVSSFFPDALSFRTTAPSFPLLSIPLHSPKDAQLHAYETQNTYTRTTHRSSVR